MVSGDNLNVQEGMERTRNGNCVGKYKGLFSYLNLNLFKR